MLIFLIIVEHVDGLPPGDLHRNYTKRSGDEDKENNDS